MAILTNHLLLAHDLSEQIRVLDVVWERIQHGVMVCIIVHVEIIAAATNHLSSCLNPRLFSFVGTGALKILLVFAHLHHFTISLHFRHLIRAKGYLFILLLSLDLLLFLMSILHHFFIQLSIQFSPITLPVMKQSTLFGFPYFLTFLPFFLNSILNMMFFKMISLSTKARMILIHVSLVV